MFKKTLLKVKLSFVYSVDYDECKQNDQRVCAQYCQNTPGSYKCACYHGYRLVNHAFCKPVGRYNIIVTSSLIYLYVAFVETFKFISRFSTTDDFSIADW